MHYGDGRFTWHLFMYMLMMCTVPEWVTLHIHVANCSYLPCFDVRVSCYRKLNTVSTSCAGVWRPPRCTLMLNYFPSTLKTVQISENINSTNISKLLAWHFLTYSRRQLGILWMCQSSHGQKSLKTIKSTCLGAKDLLPIRDCCLVQGLVFLKVFLLLPPTLLVKTYFPIICMMFCAIRVKTSKDRIWARN